jgi:hypothetical protein
MHHTKLGIELFTQVQSDMEKRQYQVRAVLQNIDKDFRKNRIYPHLSHLIDIYRTLNDINLRLKDLRSKFPKRIKKIDFVNERIEHEIIFTDDSDLQQVEQLIDWGLPYIKAKIEEGTAIYEFVNEEIELKEVGIVPNYTDEGYLFVPDNKESALLLFQYEVSIFQSAMDQYRSLKTDLLKAVEQGRALPSPNAIKLDLMDEYKELPNPATYSFQTALDFPFNATIFPVAKRKLLQQLV